MSYWRSTTRLASLAWLICLLWPAWLGSCASPAEDVQPLSADAGIRPSNRTLDLPFRPGEQLVYDAFYCGFKAGEAVLRVEDLGEEGLDIHLDAATTGPASMAFPLEESTTVRADARSLRPKTAHIETRKGDDLRRFSFYFDDLSNAVVGRFLKDGNTTVRMLRAAEAWDPASLLLLVRSLNLTPPFQTDYQVVLGSHLTLLALKATGLEDVETEGGTFRNALHVVGSVYGLDEEGRPEGDPWHRIEAWIAQAGSRPVVRLSKLTKMGWVTFELRTSE